MSTVTRVPLFNMAAMKLKYSLRAHKAAVTSLAALSELFLISGDSDGWLFKWDLETRRPLQQVKAHSGNGGVIKVATATIGDIQMLISQGRDGKLTLWELFPKLLAVTTIDVNALNFCGFDHGKLGVLVVSSNANFFDVWDPILSKSVRKNVGTGDSGLVMALKWHEQSIIAGYEDGSILQWSENESELLHLFTQPVLSIDTRDNLMAFSSADGYMVLLDKLTKKVSLI